MRNGRPDSGVALWDKSHNGESMGPTSSSVSGHPIAVKCLLSGMLLLAALKLWLIGGVEIIGMEFDAQSYLVMAQHWYWDQLWMYVRPPIFPLYVAVVHEFGIPLRLANEAIYLAASASIALALLNLCYPRWAVLALFALLAFLPSSIAILSLATPEVIIAPLTLLMTAEIVRTLTGDGRRLWVHATWLALISALLWYARPETILVFGGLAVAPMLTLGAGVFRIMPLRQVMPLSAALIGLPAAAIAILGLVIAIMNGRHFGRFFSGDDLHAPAFVRAYALLQAIDVGAAVRYVPVSHDQLTKAEAVSPAFREIAPFFRSERGEYYKKVSLQYAGVENEFAGGWWIFVFREAVAQAGYHSVAETDAFYTRLANEIEAARDTGQISLRWSPSSFVDPKYEVWFPHVAASFARVMTHLDPSRPPPLTVEPKLAPEITQIFNVMANRRAALADTGPRQNIQRLEIFLKPVRWLYNWTLAAVLSIGLILLIAGGWQNLSLPILGLLGVSFVMIAGRVAIFTLVDASSFPILESYRYLFPATAALPVLVMAVGALYFSKPWGA